MLLLNDRYLAAPSIAILTNRSWKELSAVSNEGHFVRNPFRKGKLPCRIKFKHSRLCADKGPRPGKRSRDNAKCNPMGGAFDPSRLSAGMLTQPR